MGAILPSFDMQPAAANVTYTTGLVTSTGTATALPATVGKQWHVVVARVANVTPGTSNFIIEDTSGEDLCPAWASVTMPFELSRPVLLASGVGLRILAAGATPAVSFQVQAALLP